MRHAITSLIPLWGYRAALRLALQEIANGVERNDKISQCRGSKFFLLLPRLLLCRPPWGGTIPKQQLMNRFSTFSRGEWDQLCSSLRRGERLLRGVFNGGAKHRQTLQNAVQRGLSLIWWERFPQVVMGWRELLWHPALNGRWTSCATLSDVPLSLALLCLIPFFTTRLKGPSLSTRNSS